MNTDTEAKSPSRSWMAHVDAVSDKFRNLQGQVQNLSKEHIKEHLPVLESHASELKADINSITESLKIKARGVQQEAGVHFDALKERIVEVLPPEFIAKMNELQDKLTNLEDTLKQMYEEKFAALKQALNDEIEKRLDDAFDQRLKPVITEGALDGDMPLCVQYMVDEIVDTLWPDIKQEIWNAYYNLTSEFVPIPHGYTVSPCPNPFAALRAWMRYTLYPYDRTIWACLRSWSWWFFFLVRLIPVYGISQIWAVLNFLITDLNEEYRLISYIMEIKAFQFVTVGIIYSLLGCVQYIVCAGVNSNEVIDATGNVYQTHTCATNGPGSLSLFYIDMAFFLGQNVLVWIAFLLLRCSKKKGVREMTPSSPKRRFRVDDNARAAEYCCECRCCGGPGCRMCGLWTGRGGHLRHLLAYDVVNCAICLGLAALVAFYQFRSLGLDNFSVWEWQFRASLYWIRALYGMLSFPFAMFGLPVVGQILMHTRPTAYNRSGETVPVLIKKKPHGLSHERIVAAATGSVISTIYVDVAAGKSKASE